MWRWDQGHLPYFQFDNVRRIAEFVSSANIRNANRSVLLSATGLDFAAPATHTIWRQYARALKMMLLVSERGRIAEPTVVANILTIPGAVTSDEYLHYIAEMSSDPSPALTGYSSDSSFRYPLLFALKYLLAKVAAGGTASASFQEIIGAYTNSQLSGAETGESGQMDFIALTESAQANSKKGATVSAIRLRQANESLRVLSQISYLHCHDQIIEVSLAQEDAFQVFEQLNAVEGPFCPDRNDEIRRRANLFNGGTTHDFFDYPNTVPTDVVESGFVEGSKVKRTHVVIERNSKLRIAFFAQNPTAVCDFCDLDTGKTYNWTTRVIDLHHLLPLASGTRTDQSGTVLNDLVPICPSCHRAIHRYYDKWLKNTDQVDFSGAAEARDVYQDLKANFGGAVHV